MERDGVDLRGMRRWQEALMEIACAVGLFAFLFIFFNSVHPLAMHDGDDWGYASFTRGALPIWRYWNPSKVLPEILMPLCVSVAGYLVMPFTGDFFAAITWVNAFVVSMMITVYACMLMRCLAHTAGRSLPEAALLSAIFVAFHFVAFRTQRSENVHLFYSWNVNTYYNYLIPVLLNASLVLFWEANAPRRPQCGVRHGFLVLAGYLAIFSNLFCSYVLAVYAGVRLLASLRMCRKGAVKPFFQRNLWELMTIAAWGVAAVFELSGGRAQDLGTYGGIPAHIKRAAWRLLARAGTLNRAFLAVCVVSVLLALVLLAHSRLRDEADRRFAGQLLRFLICGILSCAYLLMLCAVSAPDYMDRPDVLFGGIFFMLVIVILSMSYVLRRIPRAVLLLPLLLVVLVFEADTRVKTFCEPNIDGYSAQKCNAINQAIMDQILMAAQAGLSEAEIEVPEGPYWFVPDAMARAMLNCGLIDHELVGYNVEVQDFFERYGI